MNIRKCLIAIAISAVASSAVAMDSVSDTMRDSLIKEQGYTELAEGFFMKRVGLEETYMALGDAGNQAMVEKLIESRNASQKAITEQGGNASDSVAKYDELIGQYNVAGTKVSGSQTGGCAGSGSSDLYVSAQSSGGTFALANARNDAGLVKTTNRTSAWTTNRGGNTTSSQSSTTYGASPSHSQVSIPDSAMACEAPAAASITCAGYSSPAVSIFINHLKWWDCRN